MKKKSIFEGAATALITPFKDGEIDYTSLEGMIEGQIEGGVSALVVGGTTGEAATLTDSERCELYSYVRDRVGGRIPLIFGTGTNDTRTAVKHTKNAEKIGCDGVLVVTPYYNKGTFRGVTEHYRRIAGETSLPVILYNVPTRTGVNLTIPQLEELSQVENIVGIKEAGDSTDRLTELSAFGDELYLYAGNDSQICATLALGGKGVISVVSNIFPKRISDICMNCFSGNFTSALWEQTALMEFIKLMFCETNPTPIKYAMSLKGLCTPEVRLPLYLPEESTRAKIEVWLRGENYKQA